MCTCGQDIETTTQFFNSSLPKLLLRKESPLSNDRLAILGYDGLKSLLQSIEALTVTHNL